MQGRIQAQRGAASDLEPLVLSKDGAPTRSHNMKAFNKAAVMIGVSASLTCFTAMADTAMAQTQAKTAQATTQQPATPPQTTTVNGLQVKPDGGSGPDKTKFNIVSKSEAKKQQGDLQRSGGNSMTSDGTGGGENSSGN
jgi:hypothetical protein